MAFNPFGGLFRGREPSGKDKAEQPRLEAKRLGPSAALEWVVSQVARDIEAERQRLSSVSERVLRQLGALEKCVDGIRKKGFEEGDRTYAAINMIKDTWAKKALLSFASYWKEVDEDKLSPKAMDFPTFLAFQRSTVRLMGDITMIPRQKMVLARWFEKESREMGEVAKLLGPAMDEMRSSIEAQGRLKSIDRLKAQLDDLAFLEKEVSITQESLDKRGKDIEAKAAEAKEFEAKLKRIEGRKEWSELKELDSRLKDAEERKEKLEAAIDERLGSMKRVFKLFAHDGKDLRKDERLLLEALSHSPVKTFLANDAQALEAALKKLDSELGSGAFRLSGKDEGKTGRLAGMLKSGWIGETKEAHAKALSGIEDARAGKEGIKVSAEKGEAERMMQKARLESEIFAKDRSELERKLSDKKSRVNERKKDISEFIRKDFGIEAEIA